MSPAYRTDVLDRVLESERRERERLRQTTLEALSAALQDAPVRPHEVIVFGSVSKPGSFTNASDVDVAVSPIPARDFLRLKAHLERSISRDVDLIDLDACPFADRIRASGVRWTPRT